MITHISDGMQAPDFTVPDAFGKQVDFKSPHATDHVLLVFLRYAGCPLCNLAIQRLTYEYKLLGKNKCEVVVVVHSNSDKIQKNIYGRHAVKPPFLILPDPSRVLFSLYGITPKPVRGVAHLVKHLPFWVKSVGKGFGQKGVDSSLFIVPAFFLIDKKGQVVLSDYAANFYDDATFTPIYEKLTFGV